MIGVDVAISSSSGVSGDTTSGGLADHFFDSAFAVGSGASATGGTKGIPQTAIFVGLGVVGLVLAVLAIRK